MVLDIAALVAPISDDQPAGPDLYGDLKRQRIEQAFERSIADGVAAEISDAQWQETIDLIVEQCGETRDLWLPVYLIRAATNAGQFALAVEAGELLAELITQRWADVHPKLDDLGFIGRKASCESLTRIGDFLGPLERVPLIVHPRLGAFSGAELERFRQSGPKAERFGEFNVALEALGAEALSEALAGIDAFAAAIHKVDATLTENADGDTATNFTPTYELLGKMRKAIASFMPKPAEGEGAGAADGEAGSAAASGGSGSGAFAGAVSSREDVVKALDAICAYYAHCEPGSPVPFILRRARDWISLDFVAVLEDIAPGSLGEAITVLKGHKAESASAANWGGNGAGEIAESGSPSSDTSSDDGWN